jgi:hypothetical protein
VVVTAWTVRTWRWSVASSSRHAARLMRGVGARGPPRPDAAGPRWGPAARRHRRRAVLVQPIGRTPRRPAAASSTAAHGRGCRGSAGRTSDDHRRGVFGSELTVLGALLGALFLARMHRGDGLSGGSWRENALTWQENRACLGSGSGRHEGHLRSEAIACRSGPVSVVRRSESGVVRRAGPGAGVGLPDRVVRLG